MEQCLWSLGVPGVAGNARGCWECQGFLGVPGVARSARGMNERLAFSACVCMCQGDRDPRQGCPRGPSLAPPGGGPHPPASALVLIVSTLVELAIIPARTLCVCVCRLVGLSVSL